MTAVKMANPKTEALLQEKVERRGRKPAPEKRWYEFYNIEEPGVSVKFSYGKTTDPKRYTFFHGQKYEVPVEVANHVESAQTPIWGYRPDGTGSMVKNLTGWKPRFQMREVRS